jgi:hypothetical protein
MRSFIPLILLVVLPTGCSSDPEKDKEPAPESKSKKTNPATGEASRYEDLPIEAKIDGEHLAVTITVGSGGHRLELKGAVSSGKDNTDVKLLLTLPGADDHTTSALEDLELRVKLERDTGPVRIYVQQVQRGVEYLVEPAFDLVKTIPR